jgi:riboflavin biosynthesis pyrimidine reductase
MNMGTVICDMSMSLDGFIAGPKDDSNPDRELGALEILHAWMFPPKGNFEEITGERFKKAGQLDEIQLTLVPVLLGEGIRLFKNTGTEHIDLEKISVTEGPGVTHLRFRLVK